MRFFTLLTLTLLFILAADNSALPRFALRSGSACADCHYNPTGGQLRTDRGWNLSRKGLTMMSPRDTIEMSNHLAPNIKIGLDIRGQLLGRFLENSKQLDFQRMSASFYTGIDLSEEIKLYGRYDYIQHIWEGYAVANLLPGGGYVKGGTFIPNYGVRVDDHTAYTRGGDLGTLTGITAGLIYDPTYTEAGVEAGIGIADIAFLTASVGRPSSAFRPVVSGLLRTDPSYTVNLSIMPGLDEDTHLMLGGSAANFKKNNAAFNGFDNVWMYGGYAGFSFGGFTLMGEFDIARNYILNDSSSSALMVEGSFRLAKGIDAVVRYDRFDPLTSRDKDDMSRVIFGLEIFPYSFIEIRPQYRLQIENPEVQNNSVVVQVHLFY